jgi:hypothetical protein
MRVYMLAGTLLRLRPEEPTPGGVLTKDTGEMTAPLRTQSRVGEMRCAWRRGVARAHTRRRVCEPHLNQYGCPLRTSQ